MGSLVVELLVINWSPIAVNDKSNQIKLTEILSIIVSKGTSKLMTTSSCCRSPSFSACITVLGKPVNKFTFTGVSDNYIAITTSHNITNLILHQLDCFNCCYQWSIIFSMFINSFYLMQNIKENINSTEQRTINPTVRIDQHSMPSQMFYWDIMPYILQLKAAVIVYN